MHSASSSYDHPPLSPPHRQSRQHPAKSFLRRSLTNVRHGNLPVFVLFCACLIIFLRALFGAGYDEAYSAHADAQVQKHPSVLARWGSNSQEALEERWKSLRKSTPQGLWGKIKKEDERIAHHLFGQHAREDAMHWLKVMEDKAFAGFHRVENAHAPAGGAKPLVAAPIDHPHDHAAQVVMAEPEEEDAPVPAPEHHISEDLDEHDAPEEFEHRSDEASSVASSSSELSSTSAAILETQEPSPPSPSSSSSGALLPDALDSAEHAKDEDDADEPVFH